jgi:hypothetical protein
MATMRRHRTASSATTVPLATAGTVPGVPDAAGPLGGSELCTMWTSTADASFMRKIFDASHDSC